MSDKYGNTPLHKGAEGGSREIVKLMLEHGAEKDINARAQFGYTPLHAGARSGSLDVVRLLLEHGAERDINARTAGGWTPLHGGAESGSAEVVALLLEKGADINARDDDGRVALYFGAERERFGTPDVVKLLIERGAVFTREDFAKFSEKHTEKDEIYRLLEDASRR